MNLLRYACLAAFAAWLSTPALAQPGALDPSFGTGGIVVSHFGGAEVARGLLALPGGRVLVAGDRFAANNVDFLLARYAADGTLDPSFGTGGHVTTGFGVGRNDFGQIPLAYDDGRILVLGHSMAPPGGGRVAIARYTPDGTLDPSFGMNGTVLVSTDGSGQEPVDAAILSDGRILVGSWAFTGTGYVDVLTRLLPNGALDPSYGTGGVVRTAVEQGSFWMRGMVVRPDGHTVTLNPSRDPSSGYPVLRRYTADGTLDPAFGTGGVAIVDLGAAGSSLYQLALLANGKMLLVGEPTFGGTRAVLIARLNEDGSVDGAFGDGGTVTTVYGTGLTASQLAVEPGGHFVVRGLTVEGNGNVTGEAVSRYLPDGGLDASFGDGGVVTFDPNVVAGAGAFTGGLAVADDGRIILGGKVGDAEPRWDVLLMRFLGGEREVAGEPGLPSADLSLVAYPNPAADAAAIRFTLARPGFVRLAAYDLLGREVVVLAEGAGAEGEHTVDLDASRLPPGLYLLRLATPTGTASQRLTVVR